MATTWLFDLVHYPYDPDPAAFDPKLAVEVFDEHLVEWTRAEAQGFDGLFLGEHHFTAYNMTPSPNVMLAAIAARTTTLRLGVMANIIPFHSPLRLAEEIAMLDHLTHGRLECGLGRGIDEQEFLRFNMPFEEARPRMEEGIELMTKAWTQSPFEHDGKFWQIGSSSIYPRPLQQPHPPIWITATSPPSVEWAARQGYPMTSAFHSVEGTAEAFGIYRAAAKAAGQPTGPDRFGLLRNVYVGETTADAKEQAEGALNHLFGLFFEAALPADPDSMPDDYAYYRSFFRPFVKAELSFEDLCDAGLVVVGGPTEVRDQLVDQLTRTECGHLLAWMNFGNLPTELVARSEELFAAEVLPALKEL